MANYEYVGDGRPDGTVVFQSGEKGAFYGAVPVVQRPYSSAVHATSGQSVSASFGATQLATLQEIQKTLIGLGIWATV
jgi:hypothetical protein